jgi:hypothetical protein
MEQNKQTVGFKDERRLIVSVNESGIYLSSDNMLLRIDPVTGEETEITHINIGIDAFANDANYTLVAAADNISVFNTKPQLLDTRRNAYVYDFAQLAGDYSILGSRNSTELRILQLRTNRDAEIFTCDPDFEYRDVRINADLTRVIMKTDYSFRVYDINGDLINETQIPDTNLVSEYKFSPRNRNLAIIYHDALRVYSGSDGTLLYEKNRSTIGILRTLWG